MYLLVLAILIAMLVYVFFSGEAQRSLAEKKSAIVKKKDEPQVIVEFQGRKYDITSFLKKHPGGAAILREMNGKDIESAMLENEHSNKAYQILERYLCQ